MAVEDFISVGDSLERTLPDYPTILVVALRADEATFLSQVTEGALWDLDLADELRRRTDWLWYGSKEQFKKLEGLFTADEIDSPSEYDVVLVSLELDQPDNRFRGDRLQIMEAFRALATVKRKPEIRVSSRLPNESFVGLGFHKKG
ncbi:MAG: hypothetical protein V1792_27945 [Pseudomonadota bacterium]